MIPSKRLRELCECFPKAQISNPNFYSSYFFDENGKTIGWIDFQTGVFTLDEKYDNFELASKVLTQNNVEYQSRPVYLSVLVYGNTETFALEE